ncbi:16322_t:CDS:1, partial [Cetraspora pellucida]
AKFWLVLSCWILTTRGLSICPGSTLSRRLINGDVPLNNPAQSVALQLQ